MKNVLGICIALISVSLIVYLVWANGPSVAIWIQDRLYASLSACVEPDPARCNEAFARLGQTGDLFGAVTSVFSGLALLAVALTVWIDAASRRSSRKPLLVCRIDDEERISFDEPSDSDPRAVRVTLNLRASALNDVAMNIAIAAELRGDSWSKSFGEFAVPVPLSSDGEAEVAKLAVRLNQSEIEGLVNAYNRTPSLTLEVQARCVSLEGIKWQTSVNYILKFRDADVAKIKGLVGGEAELHELWANQAVVQPDYQVSAGSWNHRKDT